MKPTNKSWENTFRKFYNNNESGGSSRWLVAPNVVEVFIRQAIHAAVQEERKKVKVLLEELVDDDECSYDHHGYCQTHAWMYNDEVCPHKRAKEFLSNLESKNT